MKNGQKNESSEEENIINFAYHKYKYGVLWNECDDGMCYVNVNVPNCTK